MQLATLLQDFYPLPNEADLVITGLELDSRKVKPNSLFIAIKGTQVDGRKYIDTAISQGATAVLVDANENEVLTWKGKVPILPIKNLQKNLGFLAAKFYDYPAKKLKMIGATGTNGKTSCTHFIAQLLQAQQIPCGIIGTLGCGFYGALGEAGLTTPDPITLQATLNNFVKQGAKAVAMEVSSHSIDQGRIQGIDFDIGVFTNLTQDHLDYHGTMENYANVKKRFLSEQTTKSIILNQDDDYGNQWLQELKSKQPYAYSIKHKNKNMYAENVQLTLHGIKAQIHSPWGSGEILIPLIGQFNLSNILAVLSTLCVYGIPFQEAIALLTQLEPVPGRMQKISLQEKGLAVVDYAHTPDALDKVLQALRAHTQGKLICVFGCGGDRDKGKRPLMAQVAERWADQIIVTNDNPRHELPEDIASQIMQGFQAPERIFVELDRSKAIQKSIQWSSADDCILIAGKGAEHYQQIGDTKYPFDDVSEVKKYFERSV